MKSEIMDQSSQEEFMKLLQENMSKLMEDAALEESLPTVPTRQTTGEFQDTISQTLKKLKASSSEAEVHLELVALFNKNRLKLLLILWMD